MSVPPEKHDDSSPDEPVEPVDQTADDTTPPEPAGPTRRERRERRGGPAGKVPGPPPGRRYPVPAKSRDYATRRRG